MTPPAGMPEDFSRVGLEAAGYVGWQSWRHLRTSHLADVPRAPGCYVIFRLTLDDPKFLPVNPGGRFKGKDPTVPPARMASEWVTGVHIVYVGKADNLFTRLKTYARFGAGEPVAHWGGRLIWQLADADDLVAAWHPLTTLEPARALEKRLLARFSELHDGRRPLANLTG